MDIFHGISIFIISSFSPLHRYFVHLSPVSYGDFHGRREEVVFGEQLSAVGGELFLNSNSIANTHRVRP